MVKACSRGSLHRRPSYYYRRAGDEVKFKVPPTNYVARPAREDELATFQRIYYYKLQVLLYGEVNLCVEQVLCRNVTDGSIMFKMSLKLFDLVIDHSSSNH